VFSKVANHVYYYYFRKKIKHVYLRNCSRLSDDSDISDKNYDGPKTGKHPDKLLSAIIRKGKTKSVKKMT
jgi:hypothetical protein